MKELYIECYEEIYNTLIEKGLSPKDAEEIASEKAYTAMQDRYADMIDQAYERHKDKDL